MSTLASIPRLFLFCLLLCAGLQTVNAANPGWFTQIGSTTLCSGYCSSTIAVFRNEIVAFGVSTNISSSIDGGSSFQVQSRSCGITNVASAGVTRFGMTLKTFTPIIGPHANREVLLAAGGSDSATNTYFDTWIATSVSPVVSFTATNCASSPTASCAGSHNGRILYGASVTLNAQLFVIGGRISGASATVHNDVWYTSTGTAWQQVTTSGSWFSPRAYAGAAVDSSSQRIVLVGGLNAAAPFNDVWISNSQVTQWTLVSSAPAFSARSTAALLSSNEYLYLLSGVGVTSNPDNWVSVDDGQSWQQVTSAASYYPAIFTTVSSAVMWGRSIVVVGSNTTWQAYTA